MQGIWVGDNTLVLFNWSITLSNSITQPTSLELVADDRKDFSGNGSVNSLHFTLHYAHLTGIITFLISIAVSFIGYTLVFGNLSYYGVIVILGLVSSFPSLLSYFFLFLFLFFPFFLILFIIVFLFFFTV
jgi:hypothetical protein